MMVTVLDLEVGNLGNVERALRAAGAEPEVTDDPARVESSRCLVLPGVGAFRPPRERLRGPLEAALRRALDGGAWLLGICVGYQLLFESSEEGSSTDGLGLLPGKVRSLPGDVPRPHIGWNGLHALASPWAGSLLDGLEEGEAVYFVHSYAPAEVPLEAQLAATRHGDWFPAVVARDRVVGTQFHPEKSGPTGRRILTNYLETSLGSLSGD